MIKIEFTEEDIKALNYERYHHPHPRVQQKMEALWLKSQGQPHNKIAKLTGVSINVVTQYIKEYQDGGIEKLKEINFYRPKSKLSEHKQTIENYFREHPFATMKEAMGVIEELTGELQGELQGHFPYSYFIWQKIRELSPLYLSLSLFIQNKIIDKSQK